MSTDKLSVILKGHPLADDKRDPDAMSDGEVLEMASMAAHKNGRSWRSIAATTRAAARKGLQTGLQLAYAVLGQGSERRSLSVIRKANSEDVQSLRDRETAMSARAICETLVEIVLERYAREYLDR